MEPQKQPLKLLPRGIAVFAALMVAAGILLAAGEIIGAGFPQLVLVSIGAAIMGSSLTFLLTGVFWWAYREQTIH